MACLHNYHDALMYNLSNTELEYTTVDKTAAVEFILEMKFDYWVVLCSSS